MTHDEIQDLLEAYVDETLDRPTRREVDAHLAGCNECRAILEHVAPVDIGVIGESSWGADEMRRAVRRSMFQVAADVLFLLSVAWLAVWLLSLFVVQPLIINRGGRAEAATIATADLAVMYNPGATVTEYSYQSSLLSRVSEVTVAVPVGSAIRDIGVLESRIGLAGFGDDRGGRLIPYLIDDPGQGGGVDRLEAVVDGTVATILISYHPAIDVASATRLATPAADVRVTWAGFWVETPNADLGFASTIGYETCGASGIEKALVAGYSGGGGVGGLFAPPSIERALDETTRALQNLFDHPELLEGVGIDGGSASAALEQLQIPLVGALVVTGPTVELLAFIEEAAPDQVSVLHVDFFNWSQTLCGR